jgi:hypothetical protein
MFSESVTILEKRTHRAAIELESDDSQIFRTRKRAPTSYRPISERVGETRQKRTELRKQYREEAEIRAKAECPFRPQKFSQYPIKHSEPQHEIQRPHGENVATPKRFIDKNSERLAKRALKHPREKSPATITSPGNQKFIPVKKLQATIERLSKPAPRVVVESDSSDTPESEPHFADPAAIDRLVEDSLHRKRPECPDQSPYRPELNENSRRIAEQSPRRRDDLFEDSIQMWRAQRDRRRKLKQYSAECELRELNLRPPPNYSAPNFGRVEVSGSRDHVERMNTAHKKSSSEHRQSCTPERSGRSLGPAKVYPSPVSPAVPANPANPREIDAILAEVDAQLRKYS